MKTPLLSLMLVLSLACLSTAQSYPAGDLNENHVVNLEDLQIFTEHWLDASCSAPDCTADLDGIPGVNMSDFALLAENWGFDNRTITLVINEFMASNNSDSGIRDEWGDYDDWIEIYNYGSEAINIGGMYFKDDFNNPGMWMVPTNNPAATVIGAGGFLIIWADDETGEGTLHASFKLSASDTDEDICLFDKDASTLIDAIFNFNDPTPQEQNKSYGRLPDGSENWQVLDNPTPGKSNGVPPSSIIISEIMYHPYHNSLAYEPENIGEEYIELFNRGTESVDLSGWQFSDGVDFNFPDVNLSAGQYLVVAADVNAFKAKYPDVNNIIGGWTGHLRNRGEKIELADENGMIIDRVEYADEGDWAVRELGPLDHSHRGWQWSDRTDGGGRSLELINPNMPNEYGQNWAASSVSDGTPGIVNSVVNNNIAPLILDVEHLPIIPGPNDQPVVTARIIDELTTGITVRLHYRVDRSTYQGETVYPHYDPNDYNDVPMFDDAAHGDGLAGDGVYGARIPVHPDKTIIEFFVEARDAAGNTRTWPAPSDMSSVSAGMQQVTNLLYQVDKTFDPNAPWVPERQPIYYVIMTEMERAKLAYIGSRNNGEEDSDATMNATFISIDGTSMELCYNAGVRNRGHGTRTGPPNNYHVDFPHDRPWKNISAISFNCSYTHAQIIGSAIFCMANIVAADTTPVQVRINGANLAYQGSPMYGVYVRLETFNDDFAKKHFQDDSNGNLYSCFRMDTGGDPCQAQLLYQGANPNTYRNRYFKENNVAEDDWSDLIHMLDVLNNAPDATYLQEVSTVINVQQWVHYIALNSLLLNYETGLDMGIGDDYFLHRGATDPRFVLIPHDLDTILDEGNDHASNHGSSINQSIFTVINGGVTSAGNGVDGLKRFLQHRDIVPLYYQAFLDHINGFFNPETLDPLFDQILGGFAPQDRINAMKQFVIQRSASVLAQIPQNLTINSSLPVVNGYPSTSSNLVSLTGRANVINTRSVLVNGLLASWLPFEGEWSISGVALSPGINRVIVQTFDDPNGTGNELENGYIDVWYNDGTESTLSGTLSVNRVLDAASGPWHITDDVIVPAGITLTINPGTTLFFDAGTGITINTGGRLAAEGSQFQRIRLTHVPGTSNVWDGLNFNYTVEDNRLAYVDQEFGAGQGEAINILSSRVTIDNMSWAETSNNAVAYMEHPQVTISNSYIPAISNELIHGIEMAGDEYLILKGNVFAAGGGNDIVDWDGTGDGKIYFFALNNIFLGGGDDGLDLDATDAYIEGNIFMNFHSSDPVTTTSNAIAGGKSYHSNTNLPNHTIIRNIFVSNDHGILVKEGGYATVLNNVFVDSNDAAIQFCENGREVTGPGSGAYINGNIFWKYVRPLKYLIWESDLDPATGWPADPNVTVNNSIITDEDYPGSSNVLGSGNIDADPLFVDEQNDFHLMSISPAIGTGPCGLDMGAYVPGGAAICGEPDEITYHTQATLTVGGPGITHYKYHLKDNDSLSNWSGELDVNTPIVLTGLQNGHSYTVHASGKNSFNLWQSDPCYATSRTWTVDTSYSMLVINEVMAHTHGSDPDIIELYYDGPALRNLAGMSMSDDPTEPDKFIFSSANVFTTFMNPGDYMVLYGDLNTGVKNHIGFALSADGEGLYLYDRANPDGSRNLIDSVEFGPQINDYSIGRVGYGSVWKLTKPTFGYANEFQPLGDPAKLKINEWLANGQVLFEDDFIELYNPHPNPVDLSDMYLTDNPVTQPAKQRLGPLSFIPPDGYAVFVADDANAPGHLNFKLSADQGMIGLFDAQLKEIDKVLYGPQTTDASYGRSPDGSNSFIFFELPTPGVSNPLEATTTTLVPEDASKSVLVPTGPISDNWKGGGAFDDSGWNDGTFISGKTGGVGYDTNPDYKPYISYDVQTKMHNVNGTCYIRIPFTVDANVINDITGLTLKIRYDDGFLAYINGAQLVTATRNFTGTPDWNSLATGTHADSDAVNFEQIPISAYLGALRSGSNILAIHGLNGTTTGSSDFLISPELEATITEVNEAFPYPEALKLLDGLRITELMYHAPDGSEYDYIELYNISDTMLDLNGIRLAEGIDFTFPPMTLASGHYVVVVSNIAAFQSYYHSSATIAGEYSGNLSNAGENIVLQLPWPLEAAILRFQYSDTWHPTTDGGGNSLTILDPTAHPATWDHPESWQAALPSPGYK